MKKPYHFSAAIFAAAFAMASLQPVAAVDTSLQITPLVSIPVGTEPEGQSYESYGVGGGLSLTADLAFLSIIAPYFEAGYRISPLNKADGSLGLANGGAGLALVFHPLARLTARVGGGGGFYAGILGEEKNLSLYYAGRAELGYRFSPTFSLLGSFDYASYLTDTTPLYSGISAGVAIKVGLGSLSGRNTGLVIDETQTTDVFPLRYYSYDKEGIGTITVTNREEAEIRDVEVFVRAGGYGSREALCGQAALLRKGANAEFPLRVALNESVLAFTESTKVQAEVLVRYKLLNAAMESTESVALRFNHRNAITWADPRMAAAFVSPNDPAMLDLSKYLAGLIRDRVRPEIDKNLQYGMGIFEGLRLSGIVWSADPSTPYKEFRGSPDRLDYLQYPYQTLAYKGGDSDDVAVLCAAALESVGLGSALVPLPDEMLVAFSLSTSEAQAQASLTSAPDLVYVGEKAWVPLQVSLIREGFLRAWQGGAKKWREAETRGALPELVVVADAWKVFSPVGLPDVDFRPPKPSEDQVALAFDNVLGRFVAKEIEPKVKKLLVGMGNGGDAKQRNNLGILYARYGLLDEAKAEFEVAASKGYSPAYTNLANVAFLKKDFETAARWFEEALKLQPNNKAALIGLARARYELDAYAEADDLFGRVKAVDPALAERYAYLSSTVDGSATRASSAAADRGGAMSWSDED
jgi:hypothetical protein